MKIEMYRANRLNQMVEYEPTEVIDRFLAAVDDGYELPQWRGLEFGLRWWMAGTDGLNVTWDESDFQPILDELRKRIDADGALKERLTVAVYGED